MASKKRKNKHIDDDGFAEWGGYMAAKQAKLMEQFQEQTNHNVDIKSDIFKGIAIFVNGYTKPNAEELKVLMAENGGVYHTYQVSGVTTHIIASNLPNVKINKLGSVPIVKPGWISDSLTLGRLLDYRNYLLYTNRSRTQPSLKFCPVSKNGAYHSDRSTLVETTINEQLVAGRSFRTSPLKSVDVRINGDILANEIKDGFKSKNTKQELENSKLESENGNLTSENKFELVNKELESDNCKLKLETSKLTSENKFQLVNKELESDNCKLESETSKLTSENKFELVNKELESDNCKLKSETSKLRSENKFEFVNKELESDNFKLKSETSKLTSEKKFEFVNKELKSDNCKLESETSKLTSENKLELENCTKLDSKNSTLQFNSEASVVSNESINIKANSYNGDIENIPAIANNPRNSSKLSKTGNAVSNKAGFKTTKTASDPKFLSEFYSNSRLHLIATLGAEFKQLINEMRENKDWQFTGLAKLKRNDIGHSQQHASVIMHIDMDCFFVSVGLRDRPELRGKPVAVTHSKGGQSSNRVDRRAEIALYTARLGESAASRLDAIDNNSSLSEIASCSYEARKRGIKNGMFMGTALKLCPELRTIPYDFQGYREVSSTLYQTIAEYTLNIEAVSCDEMYVDITQLLKNFNLSVYAWADHIRDEIRSKTGCPCSTGFGSNRLQARLATKKAKPDGRYHLLPEDVDEYMAETRLSELPGVGRATLAKLVNLGYETCGDLQSASLDLLRKELGSKGGETIYEQAQGVDKKPLVYEHERKSVSAEVNYGIRFKNNEESLQFLESLAVEVYGRLIETGMKGKCVTLKLMVRANEAPTETAKFLGHGVCDSLSRSSTLNTFIGDAKIIYKEARSLYEKLNIPFADLRGVGIQLSRLEKGSVNNVLKKFLDGSTTKTNIDVSKNSSDIVNKSSEINNSLSLIIKEDTRSENKKDCDKKIINKQDTCKKPTRGRPKSSKLTKAVKRNDGQDLSIYFKSTQKNRQISKTYQNECLAAKGIDLEVLQELPEEIRNEILKEYQVSEKMLNDSQVASTSNTRNESSFKKTKNHKNQSKISATSRENGAHTAKNEKTEIEAKSRKKKSLTGFHMLEYDDLKVLLRNWLESETIPLEVDTKMLSTYFKQLAIDRKIENLHMIVKFLHRNIISKNNCSWREAYFLIIDSLQEGMMMRYGNRLQVPLISDAFE